MTVTYWTGFSKRKNSTKQPTSGTDATVKLKDNCSVINPTIQTVGIPANANYFYISDFGRYYFVSNVTKISNAITEFNLEVDVLASYKSQIGSTSAHIVYSSTGYDTQVVDNRIAVKTTKQITDDPQSMGIFDSTGLFILSVTNVQSSANGFVTTYVCNDNTLDNVANVLMNMDIDARIIKAIYHPFDCVISCTWLPLSYSTFSSNTYCSSDNIKFGDYDSGIPGNRLTSPLYSNITTFTLTPRYSDFRAMQPYTSYSLLVPMYGVIDLNASDIRNLLSLNGFGVGWQIDLASGDVTMGIYTAAGTIGQTINFNLGVNCPIAQTSNNMTGTISGVGGVAGGIVGTATSLIGGNVPGAVMSGLATLTGASSVALGANSRSTSIKGGINGRSSLALGGSLVLFEYAMDTEDPDDASYIAAHGRPVGEAHAISNHSGYVQCEGASCNMAGSALEKERVNNYLNSGFFYE